MNLENNKLATAIRLAIIAGAASTVPFNVVAEEVEDNNEAETISVTGSRIQRAEFSSTSPIAVFDEEDVIRSGVTSVDEFLKNIPAFTGFQLGSTTNNGGDGQKKVDMRGLGFNRTLVIINGRRQIGDVNGDGAVDLNAIPISLIERIEVLKDGASTIYGTDAIAGVVNIILKQGFEGFKISAGAGAGTKERDAFNRNLSVLMGVVGERGEITTAIEFQHQGEMLQADRDWSFDGLYPLINDDGTFSPVASGSSNSRRIRNVPGATGQFIVDENSNRARAFNPVTDLYNFSPVNALVTPNDRWQIGTTGRFELLPNQLTAYMEGLYTKRESQQRLAPDASFFSTANYTSLVDGSEQTNDRVPASNPFNPFGDNPANDLGISGQAVRLNRRFEESGGRLFRQSADTFRLVTGLQGEIGNDITWDLSYTFAQNEVVEETKNYHRFDRWEIAVTPSLCAANAACSAATALNGRTAINPFGAFGSISPEEMAFLTANSLKDQYFGELKMWQLNVSGVGMELGGGDLGWAVGVETRSEYGFFSPDEFTAEGLTTSGASDPQVGEFDVEEFYAEVLAPITDTLLLDGSIRHSNYSNSAGSTTNFKVGFDFTVMDGLRFRGNFATGFRAPNISEINQDRDTSFPVIESLCEFADRRTDLSDVARQNCTDYFTNVVGEPELLGAEGEIGFGWQSTYTTQAPSTPLEPEESESFTVGTVVSLPAFEGVSFSIDYWSIEIENFIDETPMNDLFFACVNSPGFSADACSVFPDLSDANSADEIARATAFFNEFPNAQGMPYDGSLPNSAESVFGNIGVLSSDGVDLEFQYKTEVEWGAINKFEARFASTYYLSREQQFPLIGTRDVVGTADGFEVFPELRFNTSIRLSSEDWTVSWDTTYIDETKDKLRPPELTDDPVAEAIWYHNLVGTYSFNFLDITFGINNVLDEDPPRFHSAFNANTEPGVYDVIGRRAFLQVSASF